jgi:hypothetical protein
MQDHPWTTPNGCGHPAHVEARVAVEHAAGVLGWGYVNMLAHDATRHGVGPGAHQEFAARVHGEAMTRQMQQHAAMAAAHGPAVAHTPGFSSMTAQTRILLLG